MEVIEQRVPQMLKVLTNHGGKEKKRKLKNKKKTQLTYHNKFPNIFSSFLVIF